VGRAYDKTRKTKMETKLAVKFAPKDAPLEPKDYLKKANERVRAFGYQLSNIPVQDPYWSYMNQYRASLRGNI
jgi:hypothetical protein